MLCRLAWTFCAHLRLVVATLEATPVATTQETTQETTQAATTQETTPAATSPAATPEATRAATPQATPAATPQATRAAITLETTLVATTTRLAPLDCTATPSAALPTSWALQPSTAAIVSSDSHPASSHQRHALHHDKTNR